MKNSVAQVMSSTSYPAILCVSSDDTDLTIRSFEDIAGDNKITILSNLKQPKSPITGKDLPERRTDGKLIEASSSMDDLAELFPVVASCQECQHDMLVAKDVAVELDGEEVSCMNCGEAMEVSYYGDFAEEDDLAEDDEADSDSSDDDDASDSDEDTEDKDSADSDEDKSDDEADPEDIVEKIADDEDTAEDTSMEDGDDSEDKSDEAEDDSDEADEDMGDDDSDSEDEPEAEADDDSEDEPEEDDSEDDMDDDAPKAEEVSVTVATASMSNIDDDLRLVACDSNLDRVEVFKGPSHIGRILKAEADQSPTFQALFSKPANLHIAFSTDLNKEWDNVLSSSVLDSYGFKPSSVEFTGSELVDQAVDEVRQEAKEELEEKIAETEEAFVATLSIAMAGINKGVLDGPNFGQEIANTLSRYGVVKASTVAQRVVDKVSEPFLRSALTHAANLRKEGVDYTRGLSTTIENASFQISTTEVDPSEVTSAVAPVSIVPSTKPVVESASTLKPKSPNRYRSAFSRFGR